MSQGWKALWPESPDGAAGGGAASTYLEISGIETVDFTSSKQVNLDEEHRACSAQGSETVWVADQEAGLLALSTRAHTTTLGRRMGTGCQADGGCGSCVSSGGGRCSQESRHRKPRALVLFPWAPVSQGLQADLTVGSRDQTVACGTVVRL